MKLWGFFGGGGQKSQPLGDKNDLYWIFGSRVSVPLAAVKVENLDSTRICKIWSPESAGEDRFPKSIVLECFWKSHISEGRYEEYGARPHISLFLSR